MCICLSLSMHIFKSRDVPAEARVADKRTRRRPIRLQVPRQQPHEPDPQASRVIAFVVFSRVAPSPIPPSEPSRGICHFVRRYFLTGKLAAILSHERSSSTFAKRGDSGSLIVSTRGEFLALLTGGTTGEGSHLSDITHATPFEWVWDIVKAMFPGASLAFDNLEELLAHAA